MRKQPMVKRTGETPRLPKHVLDRMELQALARQLDQVEVDEIRSTGKRFAITCAIMFPLVVVLVELTERAVDLIP